MERKRSVNLFTIVGAAFVSLLTSSCDQPYFRVSPSKMEFGIEGGKEYIHIDNNHTGWKAEIVEGASWINMKYIPNYGRDTIEAGTPLVIPDKGMYRAIYNTEDKSQGYSYLIITVVKNNNTNERKGLIAITSDNLKKFPEYKYAVTIIQQGRQTEPED